MVRLTQSNLTAVCVAGALRTFLQPPVQQSFVGNLHHTGHEYFIATDQPRPATAKILVAPIRAWIAHGLQQPIGDEGRPNTPTKDKHPRGRCPRGTCNPFRFLYPFVERLAECYYAIQAEEGSQRLRYSVVLRLRPDHILLRRMPPVHPVTGWLGVPLVPGRILLWDDQISVSRRDDAAAMLLTPVLAYQTCADEKQWERGIRAGGGDMPADWSMAKCRETGLTPGPDMALLAVFGRASSWRELPLRPRQWPVNKPSVEDFCMKRERWVNETAGRAQSENVAFEC